MRIGGVQKDNITKVIHIYKNCDYYIRLDIGTKLTDCYYTCKSNGIQNFRPNVPFLQKAKSDACCDERRTAKCHAGHVHARKERS